MKLLELNIKKSIDFIEKKIGKKIEMKALNQVHLLKI
jgi:hypothetical protein